jgi:hypothetical protein
MTFSREKVVFTILKVTFSGEKVILSRSGVRGLALFLLLLLLFVTFSPFPLSFPFFLLYLCPEYDLKQSERRTDANEWKLEDWRNEK